jgi:UDP-N-acetylglucosamine--N-acetylmuramyl-(pentapeptide) pyrophosphoryl-undecaprenol N-acetylglucosamine transferase
MGNTGELFSEARKTIFILGGSQGSVLLNTCIKNFFEQNLPVLSLVQVIHQIGAQDQFDWVGFYKNMRVPAFVFSYNEDLAACYRATDVIVCRAGAGTLFEVLFFNKRALVVPLVAQTTSHQVDNAQALAQEHLELFTVVLQQDIIQDQKIFNNTLKILLEVNKI